MTALPDDLIAVLNVTAICFVTTPVPDGSSQISQARAGPDGEHIAELSRKYLGRPYPASAVGSNAYFSGGLCERRVRRRQEPAAHVATGEGVVRQAFVR